MKKKKEEEQKKQKKKPKKEKKKRKEEEEEEENKMKSLKKNDKNVHRKTQNPMTMHKSLHPEEVFDRQYLKPKQLEEAASKLMISSIPGSTGFMTL